jgi:alpha-glucosidase
LYLDDGDSINQTSTSNIVFTYNNGAFSMSGDFGYQTNVSIKNITLLGATGQQTIKGPVALTGAYQTKFNGTGTSGPEFPGTASSVKAGMGAMVVAVAAAVLAL